MAARKARRGAPLAALWLSVLVALGYNEYEYRRYERDVRTAAGEDTQRLRLVRAHLVVGYDDAATIRELARRGYIGGVSRLSPPQLRQPALATVVALRAMRASRRSMRTCLRAFPSD